MSNNKGILEDVKKVRSFLIDLELSEECIRRGGDEQLLLALRSIGNIEGILTFHDVMLKSVRREIDSLYRDISGDEEQVKISSYNEEKIYD